MEEYKNISKNIAKEFKKMHSLFDETLSKIREKEPEAVDSIIKDHKSVMLAVKKGDVSALMDLQKKYADKSNK